MIFIDFQHFQTTLNRKDFESWMDGSQKPMCHCWRHHIWQDTLSAARSTAYGPIAVAQRGPFFAQEKTWQFQLSSESFVVHGLDTCILNDKVMIVTKISWGEGPIWQVLDGEIALCIIFLGSVEASRFVELLNRRESSETFWKNIILLLEYNSTELNQIYVRFIYDLYMGMGR